MRKQTKPNMVEVAVEPVVLEMLQRIAKAEKLTPEQVLNRLLDERRARTEAKR